MLEESLTNLRLIKSIGENFLSKYWKLIISGHCGNYCYQLSSNVPGVNGDGSIIVDPGSVFPEEILYSPEFFYYTTSLQALRRNKIVNRINVEKWISFMKN